MQKEVIGILGLGAMGQIIAKDLASSFNGKVIYLVRDVKAAKKVAKKFKAEVRFADVSKPSSLVKAFKGIKIVIHAVHHEFNVEVMKACLKAKCHYVDLGGLFYYTIKQLKLNKQFEKNKLTAVIGMGASPGITNVMAKYAAHFFDEIEDIQIRIGMKDNSKYKQVSPLSNSYSLQTILEGFSWSPAVYSNRQLHFVDPMSGRESYKFPNPVGTLKPQYTIHSELATLPFTLRARNVSFKIAFDDDFVNKVKMLKDLGLTEDKEISIKDKRVNIKEFLVNHVKNLPKTIPERIDQFEIIRVVVRGTKEGKEKEVIIDAKIHGISETIDKDTGVPPSIVAQFILENKIKEKGVLPPELVVPEGLFFSELAKRKIYIELNGKRIN